MTLIFFFSIGKNNDTSEHGLLKENENMVREIEKFRVLLIPFV